MVVWLTYCCNFAPRTQHHIKQTTQTTIFVQTEWKAELAQVFLRCSQKSTKLKKH